MRNVQTNSLYQSALSLPLPGKGLVCLVFCLWCSYAERTLAQVEASAEEAGQVVLHADQSGHFKGTLTINKVNMPFVIDTGATMTTLPMNLAAQAHLPFGKQIEVHTAAGRSFSKMTTINSLKLGRVEIQNIDAHVNQYLNEVLIGMNTLKYFKIVQTADTMTLSLDKAKAVAATVSNVENTAPAPVMLPDTPSRPIKSKQVCDEKQHCITRFDNE